jgi:hypothetical protein
MNLVTHTLIHGIHADIPLSVMETVWNSAEYGAVQPTMKSVEKHGVVSTNMVRCDILNARCIVDDALHWLIGPWTGNDGW